MSGLFPWRALAALVLFGSLMPAAHAGDGSSAELYDKAHSAETQSVFDFIRTRTLASRSNMIEGQHMGGPGDLSSAPQVFDMNTYRIASASPRRAYPRMIGARYDANLDATHYVLEQAYVSQINARLLDASAIYHPIVSITATPPNPWDRNSGRSSSPKDKALSKLFLSNRAPDTPAGRFWDDIDTIADGLQTLSDAGIPVVFRPFAEVNTGEKYYADGKLPADFVTLWNQVADYYVNQRHLHNLIFCWEAWVFHRTAATSDLDPWYPRDAAGKSSWVDVVSGAFYFLKGDTGFFKLEFPAGGNDERVFYSLMKLAVDNDKPFGAAQYAVNYKYAPPDDQTPCGYGDNANTLQFMTSIDAQHSQPTALGPVQHLAFAYYWGDNKACMDVQSQAHATQFVDDVRVASITGIDAVNTESGTVRDSPATPGAGALATPGWPVRTGDTNGGAGGCKNCQSKAVLSFYTQQALPADAVVGPSQPTLLLTQTATGAGTNPFAAGFAPLSIDAANRWFGGASGLAPEDFSGADRPGVGQMSDPAQGPTQVLSHGSVPANTINLTRGNGRTQYRVSFFKATDGTNTNNYIDWNGAQSPPELILTYTLP